MTKREHETCVFGDWAPRRRLFSILSVSLLAATAASCRRKEAAGSGEAARPIAPVVTVTAVPPESPPPSIREAAEPGKAPFAGLSEPRGIAVDGRGRLWVADSGNSRMAIFDSAGGYLGGWGGVRGNGKFQLQEPGDVAIHGQEVYVADTWNGRVQHFTTAGEFKGTAVTGLYGPRGVAVASDGTVWISDTGFNRLSVYREGEELRFIGRAGRGREDFASPVGIAVGPSGRVYVADVGHGRIQVLRPEGHFEKMIPVPSWNGPMEPHIAVDGSENENLYLTAPSSNTVFQLDKSGKILHRWDSDDAGEKFARPIGLAFDRTSSALYVVNSARNGVTRLKLSARKNP